MWELVGRGEEGCKVDVDEGGIEGGERGGSRGAVSGGGGYMEKGRSVGSLNTTLNLSGG